MKNNIQEATRYVADRFVYTRDPLKRFDTWKVMKLRDGKFSGDCEDFALTVMWYYCGESLLKFILNVYILHKYALYYCVSKNGEGHAVGRIGDWYFDNWTGTPLKETSFFTVTKHKKKFRHFILTMIVPSIAGLFTR